MEISEIEGNSAGALCIFHCSACQGDHASVEVVRLLKPEWVSGEEFPYAYRCPATGAPVLVQGVPADEQCPTCRYHREKVEVIGNGWFGTVDCCACTGVDPRALNRCGLYQKESGWRRLWRWLRFWWSV